MSYHKLNTKPLNASLKTLLKRGGRIGLGISAFTPVLALANPTGGQVVGGQATIATPSANGTVITQTSQSAIINWQQFNIGAGQYVQFLQPSSSSVVLNRVIGGSPSSILGSLTANGQVFLVNTNGVYFGKGASIDTQGFLASTLGITDQNFLAHNYIFDEAGAPGAEIVNDGNITAHHSGYVVLAGDYAENDGVIAAQSGHVILASGSKATLSLSGNSLINFAVSQATLASYAGVKNTGSILADGGTVIMTADVANLLKATVVNNTGLVEAHAISDKGGDIYLTASGGNIENAGTLDVSATRSGQAGGDVTLKGDERTTLTSTSNIDATGESANGGSVEVSGNTLALRGLMKIGKGGKLLLDPNSVDIVASGTTAGNAGLNGGTGSATGQTKLGVGFIEGKLNSGAAVAISAHALIGASTHVKAITATGTGALSLKVNHTVGHIDLSGVDINIGGNLTASMGYGSFGHLTAAAVNLDAGSSVLLAGAVKNSKGKITTQSVVATVGSIDIIAPHVFSDSELGNGGGLALTAKQGMYISGAIDITGNLTLEARDMQLSGAISAANVSAVASNGYASFHNITATGTVSITTNIGTSPDGSFLRVGNVTAKGLTIADNGGGSGITIGDVDNATGDITITATKGNIVTGNLADYGGNLTVTDSHGHISIGYASNAGMYATGNITVTAKNSGIAIGEHVFASGVLTLAASAEGNINIHSGEAGLHGAKGVNLSGDFIRHSGSLQVTAQSGGVTLNAGIGASASAQFHGNVDINAYGGVSLGKNVFVDGSLEIFGKSLAYTGAGNLSISDHGSLYLDAAIGTKKAPVKYNVDLTGEGGKIYVAKSIFTADSLTIDQTHTSSGATIQGVIFQGASDEPITVSAKKSISVTAANIAVGNAHLPSAGSRGTTEAGAVSLIAGKNITFTAVAATSHSGNIAIGAGRDEASNSGGRNPSMLVQAGGSLELHARQISIQGGTADAEANDSTGKHSATAVADVTLKAGTNLDISASSKVNIQGGRAFASAEGGKSVTLNASADASVSITAGEALTVSGEEGVQISGGYGSVAAAAGKKGTATATGTMGVSLKAGTTLDISASSGVVRMNAGTAFADAHSGGGSHVGGGATLNAKATSGITLTAGTNIDIVASHNVAISAGYGAAFVGASQGFKASAVATVDVDFNAGGSININAGNDVAIANQGHGGRDASAFVGGDASNALTAAVDVSVNLTAGKAINMTAGSTVFMSAGYGAAFTSAHGKGNVSNVSANTGISLTAGTNVHMLAYGGSPGSGVHLGASSPSSGVAYFDAAYSGAKATATIHRDISINAGGSIFLAGRDVTLSAGNNVGGGSFPAPREVYGVDGGGNIKFTDTANINLTAGTSVTLSASTVAVHGGNDLAHHASVVGASAGQANADFEAAVNIKAGGTFTAAGFEKVIIAGGSNAGANIEVIGVSDSSGATKNTTTLNSGVSITAKAVTVATTGAASIGAGAFAGTDAKVLTDGSKAAASLTINSGLAITAKGAVQISAGSRIDVFGGFVAGAGGSASADGGKAAMTVEAATSIKAGSVLLQNNLGGSQFISGGRYTGDGATAFATAGGSANRTVDASVSITTGGALTMTGAHKVLVLAAESAASHALTSNSGGLKATTTLSNGVNLSAKSVQISALNSVEMFAGGSEAREATVKANGGSATFTVNSAINITAAQGITLNVTGTGGTLGTNRRIVLDGGSNAAQAVSVNATHGGNAALNANGGLTLTAGGVVTLKNKGLAATSTTFSGTASSIVNHHTANHGIFVVAGSRMGGSITTFSSGSHGPQINHHVTAVQAGLGGGTATLTGIVSVNISTKAAFSMDAGSGNALIAGGSSAANHMRVSAVASGKATVGLTQDVNLTAASALINGGSAVLAAGSGAGKFAQVEASHAGVATATVESAFKATTTGAFTVTANTISVTSGRGSLSAGVGTGSLAHAAGVFARGGAQATLNANGFVAIKAGSVSLTANDGFVHVFGGESDGGFASVSAAGKGDKANLNVNGTVGITATAGSIAITAKGTPASSHSNGHLGAVGIQAGSSAGRADDVFAKNAGATAGLTIDTSMNLTAKKGVVVTASDSLELDATRGGVGASAEVGANGKAAAATASVTGSVNVTAASITLTAANGNLNIDAGSRVGAGAAFGSHSGHATMTDTGLANLKATGNVAINATTGFAFVDAGFGGFSSGRGFVSASNHGVASATALSGVSITAGGSLTVSAKNDIRLSAGFGHSASVDAQNGGAATYTQDGSITLKAGTTASLTAGGNLLILGGGSNRAGGNAFTNAGSSSKESHVTSPNKPGGALTANLTDEISITAGSNVSLTAGDNLVVVAGYGNQLFVGAERLGSQFVGQRWAGGTATMGMNTSVTITAGNDLNLTAGTTGAGSLQVLGMAEGSHSHAPNQANVMGGSGSAVAKLSLIGNATLSAKTDIVINASGDASIVGGSLANIRDDHGQGHITLLGSADANLVAGHDVVLNKITGSLTVAGINVNSSHAGGILADAHASSGFASVTAHADAGITAGNSIRTVTALGGNLNVVGGQFVDAAALGHATNEQVTATADASLTAGNSVTISATGDLTVAGGLFNSAEILNSFNNGRSASGERAASVKTRADIIAKKTVTLTIGGDAVIAGGDSLTATANMSDDSFETGTTTADAGVSIKGSSVTLNVAGNLLVRGGSAATAKAIGIGGSVHATATATADASIAGVTNVTITAGSASFVGGSAGKASVQNLFSDNVAAGTVHSDVNITAGKAISVTTVHNLKVAGGPGAENSALVFAGLKGGILSSSTGPSIGAISGTATATVTGRVNFTAGTTLNVTAGGNINILGGSRGGSNAVVTAAQGSSGQGRNNTATLNVDTSVNLKGATVTLTANGGGSHAGSVNVTTFAVPSSGNAVLVASNGNNNTATATINQSVNITGKTVTINGTLNKHAGTSASHIVNSTITITGHAVNGFSPAVMHPLSEQVRTDDIQLSPMDTGGSFGGVQPMPSTSVTPAVQPTAGINPGGVMIPAPTSTGLDSLQLQGLVPVLVTVMGEASQPKPQESTAFTPALTTDYLGSFPSSCTALILDQAGSRCSAGGK